MVVVERLVGLLFALPLLDASLLELPVARTGARRPVLRSRGRRAPPSTRRDWRDVSPRPREWRWPASRRPTSSSSLGPAWPGAPTWSMTWHPRCEDRPDRCPCSSIRSTNSWRAAHEASVSADRCCGASGWPSTDASRRSFELTCTSVETRGADGGAPHSRLRRRARRGPLTSDFDHGQDRDAVDVDDFLILEQLPTVHRRHALRIAATTRCTGERGWHLRPVVHDCDGRCAPRHHRGRSPR